MLIETRLQNIVALVEQKRSVTVQEVMEKFNASESTVRRDLNTLDKRGMLVKVHGGAIAKDNSFDAREPDVLTRQGMCVEEKIRIARYAASLIEPSDFVFLDAGSSTAAMIDFISDKSVTFVTNAVSHAEKLAKNGHRVYVLGGLFRSRTGAIVGDDAIERLSNFNFTKAFIGCNGISSDRGITAPSVAEAAVKKKAAAQSLKAYILGDNTKFGMVSAVKFAEFDKNTIITDKNERLLPYRRYKNIIEVE